MILIVATVAAVPLPGIVVGFRLSVTFGATCVSVACLLAAGATELSVAVIVAGAAVVEAVMVAGQFLFPASMIGPMFSDASLEARAILSSTRPCPEALVTVTVAVVVARPFATIEEGLNEIAIFGAVCLNVVDLLGAGVTEPSVAVMVAVPTARDAVMVAA